MSALLHEAQVVSME